MKIAILETIVSSGHEVEFDRGLVKELKNKGHEPCFFVPEDFEFKADYDTPVEYLEGGPAISYRKAGFIKKIFLSVTREYRRIRWFNSALEIAKKNNYDCIFIPTATPRYLKTLLRSKIAEYSIPFFVNIHVFSFEKKGRLGQFLSLAKKLEKYKNVFLTICSPNHLMENTPNTEYVDPPFYEPSLIEPKGEYDGHEPVRIGLYGFYREDDNIKKLLKIFSNADFKVPVKLIMQTVTENDKDQLSCEKVVEEYKSNSRFEFTDRRFYGKEWQEAISNVDVILAPYSSIHYYYTYSAMCFNALGFKKPVILAPNVNPTVIEKFKVGLTLNFDDETVLKADLEKFINNFKEDYPTYLSEINKAAQVYNYSNFTRLFETKGK